MKEILKKGIKGKLLTVVFALTMVFLLMPLESIKVHAAENEYKQFIDLLGNNSPATIGGLVEVSGPDADGYTTFKLLNDITADSGDTTAYAIAAGSSGSPRKIILDLNGNTINRNLTSESGAGTSGYAFRTLNYVNLIIDDSTAEGTAGKGDYISGTITGGAYSGIYFSGTDSTLTIKNGKITGNYSTGNGGGIYAGGSTFIIEGGEVCNNTSDSTSGTNGGGGIYVGSCGFSMTGGAIYGNKATQANGRGGGIFVHGSQETFSITGGKIFNNKCNQPANGWYGTGGAGIYLNWIIDGSEIGDAVQVYDNINIATPTLPSSVFVANYPERLRIVPFAEEGRMGYSVYTNHSSLLQIAKKITPADFSHISSEYTISERMIIFYCGGDSVHLSLSGEELGSISSHTAHAAGTLWAVYHNHSFAYAKEGDVITAYCKNAGCPGGTSATNKVTFEMSAESKEYSATETYAGVKCVDADGTEIKSDNVNKWTSAGLTVPSIRIFKTNTEGQTYAGSLVSNLTGLDVGYYYAIVSYSGASLSKAFKITAPSHTHNWVYTVGTGDDANKLTATCNATGHTGDPVTLTLSATSQNHSGTPYAGLSFGDDEEAAWSAAVGATAIIKYVGRGKTTYDDTTAPTGIGRYTVKVYPAAEEENPTHVISADFNITDTHDWKYSADGNKLEVYCANEGCPSETDASNKVALTLNAESQNYSDKATYSATLDNASAWEALGLEVPTIKYFKATSEGGTDGDEEVTNLTGLAVGNYYAAITVGDVTAKKAFKIILVDGEFTVEFVNKGNVVKTISKVKANSLLAELKLSAPGFVGWYKDAECTTPWDFDADTITADTKLYAKYVDTVTVTLDANGGTFAEGTETTLDVKIGRKLSEKTLNEIGSKAKYGAMVFSGWYKDEDSVTPWDFKEDVVTEATTLYIGWGYPAGHEETAELSVTKVRDYIYTGKKITPAVSVSFGGKVLVPGVDYTVAYKNNIKAYTSVSGNNLVIKDDGSIDYSNVDTNKAPTIIIKGKKNYTNKTIALNFNILPVSLGNNADALGNSVSADINDYYAVKKNGVIKVKGTVAYKGKKLSAKDYTLTLTPDNALDADGKALPKEELAGQKIPKGASGTFKLAVKGKDNYKDGFVKTITVKENAKTLEKAKISTKKIEYSGHDLTVEEVVDASKGKLTVKIAGKTLTYGTDYEVEFADKNAKAGSRTNGGVYPIVIKAKGEYFGSRMANVTVTGLLIKKAVVTFEEANPVYTGSHLGANIKSVSINSVDNTVSLTEGIDYDVVVKNDVKAGRASVTLTGKGIYSGTKKVSYKIQKKKLTNEMFENVTISDNAIYLGKYDYYGGVAITPDVSISYNGMNLINPADYSISLKNNKKAAGTAKATIKGKGNYTGNVAAIFTIGEDKINTEKVNIKKARVKVFDQTYTGRAITISANGFDKITIAGKEGNLELGKDFEIIERSYAKNVNVGKAQFVIKGINDYDGYKLVTFRITKKDLKWWQKLFQ